MGILVIHASLKLFHTTLTSLKSRLRKVGETLELLGMDFSDFDKYKTSRNSKDRCKVVTSLCNRYR